MSIEAVIFLGLILAAVVIVMISMKLPMHPNVRKGERAAARRAAGGDEAADMPPQDH